MGKYLVLLTTLLSLGSAQTVSGTIRDGIRVLKWPSPSGHYVVYRGDYIKFSFSDSQQSSTVRIPELGLEKQLTGNMEKDPYLKMKKPGVWKLFFNQTPATIEVINFDKPNYQEIGADEARDLIRETDPFILDVRTPMEYNGGHLKDATLIPVQVLQSSLAQLDSVRNADVLVYCRTGNRSTVASNILLDNGFKRVYNLQGGIVNWKRKSYPIEK